jgi:type I restriction enzyme, S subunit
MTVGKLANWTKTNIGAVCHVGDGAHGSLKRYEDGIMYLTSKNFKSNGLDLSQVDFIDEKTYQKYFREKSSALTRPKVGDVLFSIIGSIGSPYLVQAQDFFGISSSVAILRPDTSRLLPEYLFYWIKGTTYQNALYGIKGGVAQGYVSLEMISTLPLHYPPLRIQRKIAVVLSAYNDLIEINMRRIRILEQIVQSVYYEWFGKADVQSLPAGWINSTLRNVARKIIKKYNNDLDCSLPLLDLARIPRKSCNISDFGDPSELTTSRITFQKLDVLFGSIRPYFHKVVFAPFDGVTNTSVFVIRPIGDIPISFLFSLLFSIDTVDWANQHSGGTKMPVINWDVFCSMPVILPDMSTLNKFNAIVEPILNSISNIIKRNVNLRWTRDLLLPRLVSGEVGVDQIELELET